MAQHNYFTYITTNPIRTVLYIGVTNDLQVRLTQHYWNRGNKKTFAGRYYCYNLILHERYQYVNDAITPEKELKKWSRMKKKRLIEVDNPDWEFLNSIIMDWPPPAETRDL